ncbi:MAG: caspase family protein [bacterium]
MYYAGHGEYDEKEDGYWVPVDAALDNRYQHFSNSDLLTQIRAIDARHKLLISDSCFSGNLLTRGVVQAPASDEMTDRYFQEKSKLHSVLGLTSGGDEPVSDGGVRWGGNSIFAYHLLAQLEANQAPYLATTELALRLTRLVANDTVAATGSMQTPVFQAISNQGHQGGEFFFMRRPQAPPGVLLAYRLSGAEEFQQAQQPSRDVLEAQLRQQLAAQSDNVPTADISDPESLRQEMQRQGLARALVWSLEGKHEPQASLIWKGMSLLDLKLEIYELRSGQLVLLGQQAISGERSPYRVPPQSVAESAAAFRQVAEKIVSFWDKNGARQFLEGASP